MKITLTAAGITADIDPASCQDITQPGYRAPRWMISTLSKMPVSGVAPKLQTNSALMPNWQATGSIRAKAVAAKFHGPAGSFGYTKPD